MASVGAVLLAAGSSRRFGPDNKLLADIAGEPMIRRVARAVLDGGATEVVAVTGHDEPRVRAALDGLPVRFAHNPDWSGGMGASIAAGIGSLGSDVDGALIVPGDMPLLSAALLETLIEIFASDGARSIVFPVTAHSEQRNPVLWPREFFPLLGALSGREGGKRLLESHRASCREVRVTDEACLEDVDAPHDLARARARLGSAV
jgi:molybdenum cofactor cytidylyltransferase